MLSAGQKRGLVVGVGVVVTCGLTVEVWHAFSHDPIIEAILAIFSLSYEANLPTWVASCLLLGCALELFGIARDVPRSSAHWWALFGIFAFFSFDEVAQLHERLGGHLDTGGILYFDWVIPASALLLLFAALFWRFFWTLPAAARRHFAIAGGVFVTGALITELPLGYVTERYGSSGMAYGLVDFVEESLELYGAVLFLFALDTHRSTLEKQGAP